MSQQQKHRPQKASNVDPMPLDNLQAPNVGKEFLAKTAVMKTYLHPPKRKICVCGDPNCNIGPFNQLA